MQNRKQELIDELELCQFECEAGPLKNCLQWKELVELIKAESEKPKSVLPSIERPICFLDLETTGVDVEGDFIVEISVLKLNTDYTEELKTMRINPGIPIPESATAVHGITNEMVKDCPVFASISKALLKFIDGCDIAGFNSNRFDVPMLFFMFSRVGLNWDWKKVNLIDVRNIYVQREERTLSAGVKFYLGRDHDEAHSAQGDVQATKEILFQQLAMYQDLPRDFKQLALYSNYGSEILDMAGKFTKNEAGEVVFSFGQHKGKVATSEREYLQWMAGPKASFNRDTKAYAIALLHPKVNP